ncbi:hypothetical protein EV05_0603 [Prochlorococcus sp. MIT 0601]|nr:hypothetical protein EV05_0603 [Prochlorococcus sp. MIT 0601]
MPDVLTVHNQYHYVPSRCAIALKSSYLNDLILKMTFEIAEKPRKQLTVQEMVYLVRRRWGVSYDLRLEVKGSSIYFQIMWAYLEQQSFCCTEKEYLEKVSYVVDVLNRLGQQGLIREWIPSCSGKPRVGRALNLHLKGGELLREFLL